MGETWGKRIDRGTFVIVNDESLPGMVKKKRERGIWFISVSRAVELVARYRIEAENSGDEGARRISFRRNAKMTGKLVEYLGSPDFVGSLVGEERMKLGKP